MRARLTDEKGVVFSSSATYRADGSGEVDLNRDPSLGGTYVGVEPMGLLWSMRPDTMHKRFQKTKSLEPQLVNFSVHEEEGRMLAEETNERLLIGDGVSRVLVKEGRISGILFTPPGTADYAQPRFSGVPSRPVIILFKPSVSLTHHHSSGEGPFPAILDMSTLRSERRASLLANKGFVVLTISLVEGKFESFDNVRTFHLDHFKEAIDFLKQQSKVSTPQYGSMAAVPMWAFLSVTRNRRFSHH
ncbi:unnamed protein product [Oreochromis niloticus]|nr:unnamed protein product [Mustela putorius furo]